MANIIDNIKLNGIHIFDDSFSVSLSQPDGTKVQSSNRVAIEYNETTNEYNTVLERSAHKKASSLYTFNRVLMRFITRETLFLYSNELYYSDIEKYFKNNPKINSIMFYSGLDNLHNFTYFICASTKSTIPVKKYFAEIELSHEANIDIESIDSAIEKIEANNKNMFIEPNETDKFLIDLYYYNTLSTRLESSQYMHPLVDYLVNISTYNFPAMNYSYLEVKEIYKIVIDKLLDRHKAGLFESENEIEAQKIIDGADKNNTLVQNFFNLIALLKEFSSLKTLKEKKEFFDSLERLPVKKKVDRTLFSDNHMLVSAILPFFEKRTEYRVVDSNSFSNLNKIINSIGANSIILAGAANDRISLRGSARTCDELDEIIEYLPNGVPFVIDVPQSNFESEYHTLYYNIENVHAVKDTKNKIVKIIGSNEHKNKKNKMSFFEKGDIQKDIEDIVLMGNSFGSTVNFMDSFLDDVNKLVSRLQKIAKNYDFLKNEDVFTYFSEIYNIGIKDPVFFDYSKSNPELSEKLSIEDISKNTLAINALYFHPSIDKMVRNLAHRAKIQIPQHTNNIVKPRTGTKTTPKKLKKESISGYDNLGMMKYSYIPVLDIREEEEKKYILDILINKYGNLQDVERLEEVIAESSYIAPLTKKLYNQELFVSEPVLSILNSKGEIVEKLSLDIYQWTKILEDNKILEYSDIVSTPSTTERINKKLVYGVGLLLNNIYKKMLGNSFDDTRVLAQKYIDEVGDAPIFSFANEKLRDIQKKFFEPLINHKIVNRNLKAIKNEIKTLPLSPHQKNMLLSALQSKQTMFESEMLDKILLSFSSIPDESYQIVESFIHSIKKDILSNIEKTEKEALSFVSFCKLLNVVVEAQKKNNEEDEKYLYLAGVTIIREWGVNALRLFPEQVDTAIHSILMEEKKKNVLFYIFHSMGTGKTRIALFYQLLYQAVNPKSESIFVVQGKNQKDIYEQLINMMPSSTISINLLTNAQINESKSAAIPISLTNTIYPNIFTEITHKIFINKDITNTKKALGERYVQEIEELIEWVQNNPNYLEYTLSTCTQELSDIHMSLKQTYKDTVMSETSRLGAKVSHKTMLKYFYKAQESFCATLLYIERYHRQNLIDISPKNIELIKQKFVQTYQKYFESALTYEQKQKQNNMSIMSQRIFDFIPVVEPSMVSGYFPTNGKKRNKITTNYAISHFLTNESMPIMFGDVNALHKALNTQYEPKIYSDDIWLFYDKENGGTKNISKDIKECISSYLSKKLILDEKQIEFVIDISEVFANKFNAESMYEGFCPSILYDGVPIPCECIGTDTFLADKEEYMDLCESFLEKHSDPISKKLVENVKTLIENDKIFNRLLNSFFYNEVLTDFVYPLSTHKDRIAKMSIFSLKSSKMSITFKNRIIPLKKGFGYIVGSVSEKAKPIGYSIYNGSIVKKIDKNDPVKIKESTLLGDFMDIHYSNYFAATIYFDEKSGVSLKTNSKIKFNTAYLIKINKNKTPHLIIDEAHKKANRPSGIKSKITSLTGTPTNGTPSSLSHVLFPKIEDEDTRNALASQMRSNCGISRVKNSFIVTLLNYRPYREDMIKLIKKDIEKNYSPENFKHLLKAFFEKYKEISNDLSRMTLKMSGDDPKRISLYSIIEMLDGAMALPDEDILATISKIKKNLNKGFEDLGAIHAALDSNAVVEYPGFSNPNALGQIMQNAGHIINTKLEFSVKDGKDRKYIFTDIERLRAGNIPELSNEEYLNKIKKYKLDIPSKIYKLSKFLSPVKTYDAVNKMFVKACDIFLYSPYESIQKYIHNSIVDFLAKEIGRAEALHEIPNYKELLRKITAYNISDSDSLPLIFSNKIAMSNPVDWQDATPIKRSAIKAISSIVNLFLNREYYSIKKIFAKEMTNPNFVDALSSFESMAIEEDKKVTIDISNLRCYVEDIPLIKKMEINLQEHFPQILKSDKTYVPLSFGLLHGSESEVFTEFFTDCSNNIVNNATNNKNSLLLTTRISILTLKLLEILVEASTANLQKPFYVLLNSPNSNEFNSVFQSIDRKFLASKNVFIIKSSSSSLYNDYNYTLPPDAVFMILSNYESVAEGFRFPRVHHNYISGQPTKGASILQAVSRVFFPGKVKKSIITIAGKKLHKSYKPDREIIDEFKTLFVGSTGDPLSVENYGKFIDFIKTYEEHIEEKQKPFPALTQIRFSKIAESFIAMLQFMAADIEGIEEKKIVNFISTPAEDVSFLKATTLKR